MVTSVHRSGCSEKVKVGKNFEAYQEKFRGGQNLSAGLMYTSALVLSLTRKIPLVCLLHVVDIRTNPSIVFALKLHPLIEEDLSVWLPQERRISQERRKRTLRNPSTLAMRFLYQNRKPPLRLRVSPWLRSFGRQEKARRNGSYFLWCS